MNITWDTSFKSNVHHSQYDNNDVVIVTLRFGKNSRNKTTAFFKSKEIVEKIAGKSTHMHVGYTGDRLYFDGDPLSKDRRINLKKPNIYKGEVSGEPRYYITLCNEGGVLDNFVGCYKTLQYDEEAELYYIQKGGAS